MSSVKFANLVKLLAKITKPDLFYQNLAILTGFLVIFLQSDLLAYHTARFINRKNNPTEIN